MTFRIAAAFAVAVLFCTGCASVIDGSTQPIYVATTPEAGANCVVSNDRGRWTLTSPDTVTVKKSSSVLSIRCSKPGWKDGTAYAAGRISTAGLIGMALPYVGLLNAAVDGSTGAGQKYPQSYTIELKPAANAASPTTTTPSPSAAKSGAASQSH